MSTTPDRVDAARKSSRRRGAVLEQAIIDAATTELAEVGYTGFTMDAVAARAGTNKTTIYRRWPSRAALAIAACRPAVVYEDLPDTGELRADALALLRRVTDRIASPQGQILQILAADMQSEPDLFREVRDQLLDISVTQWLTVLGRAVARGQARPEALSPRIATLAVDLVRNEYLVRGAAAISDRTLTEITDTIYLPLVQARPDGDRPRQVDP
ncbi:TetR/AcrR family transcriptional regulator [Nocardia sp. NPDC050193]